MATKPGMSPQQHAPLPRFIKVQVFLALAATAITVGLTLYIPHIKGQIDTLTATRSNLQQQITDATNQLKDAKRQLTATQDAIADQDSRQGHGVGETSATAGRIFVHIGNKAQRAQARQVAQALQKRGYAVPGLEILVDYSNPETQVRYFHPDDQAVANNIAAALAAQGVKNITTKHISGYENTVHLKQFEIWFGSNAW
jgi:hypothetical protein